MVWRPPARPSQLHGWYSSGVPAGPSLRRVDPLHLEGLCGDNNGPSRLSWWTVSGQKPPDNTFPLRCAETKAPSTVSYSSSISSLKRVGDLQALSVASTHLDFAPGMAKAFLYPRVEHVPKVPHVTPQTVVLQAFSPSPFGEPDQQKLNCMRALDAYVHRAALWRVDQLLVCCGLSKRGLPASKQTLSRWIVDGFKISYESSQLPSPMGVRAHSTRSMAASKAFFAGVPIQDICNAIQWWSMPLTFVRFYGLDMQAPPVSSVLSL